MYTLQSIKPVFLALFVTVLFLAAGCQSADTGHGRHIHGSESDGGATNSQAHLRYLSDQTPVEGPTVKLTVHGLGCPLCAGNIDRQLLRVPGVKNVGVNLKDGSATVEVSTDAPPTRAQLAKAVYESGFTLIKIE